MTNRVRNLLMPLAAFAVLALAPTAAASPDAVVRDCAEDGTLDGSYSEADKRAALKRIPADLDEYSDCRAVIAGGGGNVKASASSVGGEGPGDGAAAGTPAARKAAARRVAKIRAVLRTKARQKREKELGARTVDPRDAGVFKAANTANGMPLQMTLALIALTILALAAGLIALRRRNPAFADAIRRVDLKRFRR